MLWTWLLPVAMLLSVGASDGAGPDPDLSQLTNELLTASGAEPVDCGNDDFDLLDYIGCGKVAVPLDEFVKRTHAELIKRGWKTTDKWRKEALTCGPPSPDGPHPTAKKEPYTLFFNLRCPAGGELFVLIGWARTPTLVDPNIEAEVTPPERVTFIEPEYPKKARKKEIEGKVILELLVGRTGNVEEVKIIDSVPIFDQAAIDAARQWKYRPAMLKGAPVKVYLTAVVEFNLD